MKYITVTLVMLASLFAMPVIADPVLGTILSFPKIAPLETIVYKDIEVRGFGSVTTFSASATGDIDCILLNEKGHVIAKDTTLSNKCTFKVRNNSGKNKKLTFRVWNASKDTQTSTLSATVVIQ